MKIGIVNDSLMAAEVLRRIIQSAEGLELLWIAENGEVALKFCRNDLPDLILMDLVMPVMDGVEATRQIMLDTPCAILVVTASVTGNSSMVFEAMGAGALDVVATPILGDNGTGAAGSEELLHKIATISHLIGCSGPRQTLNSPRAKPQESSLPPLVVIGASTGGPKALTTVLSAFPNPYPGAIVLIQHMDKKFTPGLASWLDQQIRLPVQLINEGDQPEAGVVHLPYTDVHLLLTKQARLSYSIEPENNYYHPSVDVFLQTVAQYWHGKIIAALLTGMGRDGAQGLLTVKRKGCHTIAQDEESSIVYGMPKAAKDLSAAKEILPLTEIGPRIIQLTEQLISSAKK